MAEHLVATLRGLQAHVVHTHAPLARDSGVQQCCLQKHGGCIHYVEARVLLRGKERGRVCVCVCVERWGGGEGESIHRVSCGRGLKMEGEKQKHREKGDKPATHQLHNEPFLAV